MTKEELEKEADCYVCIHWTEDEEHDALVKKAYLASAEPREKQIQIDAKQIRALQKQNGELTDKVKELETQIEKMKCCANCRNITADQIKGGLVYSCGKTRNNINFFKACDKWEIKEK